MAKLKLSELPLTSTRNNSDVLYIVQQGSSQAITVGNLLANLYTAGQGIIIEANNMIVSTSNDYPEIRSTDNLAEGTTNLYFSNARSLAAVQSSLESLATNLQGNVDVVESNVIALQSSVANLDTSNVIEGSNLYFTNTRAVGALTAGANIEIASNGMITAIVGQGVDEYLLENFNTDDLLEANNLYFTNARVVSALTAGPGVHIDANGMISFNSAILLGGTQDGGSLVDSVTQIIEGGELTLTPTQLIDYGTL